MVVGSQGSPNLTALVDTILVGILWSDPTPVTHPYKATMPEISFEI